MKCSYHAIKRFQERTGCKSQQKARKSLIRIAGRSKAAFGYNNGKTIQLFTKEHFVADGWVLVIKDDTIITCFMADREQCM